MCRKDRSNWSKNVRNEKEGTTRVYEREHRSKERAADHQKPEHNGRFIRLEEIGDDVLRQDGHSVVIAHFVAKRGTKMNSHINNFASYGRYSRPGNADMLCDGPFCQPAVA